jgi:hypothetical protein
MNMRHTSIAATAWTEWAASNNTHATGNLGVMAKCRKA